MPQEIDLTRLSWQARLESLKNGEPNVWYIYHRGEAFAPMMNAMQRPEKTHAEQLHAWLQREAGYELHGYGWARREDTEDYNVHLYQRNVRLERDMGTHFRLERFIEYICTIRERGLR